MSPFRRTKEKNLYEQCGLENYIDVGKEFPANGSKHLIFFDCSDASAGERPHETQDASDELDESSFGAVNSRIIAGLLESLEKNETVKVHVVAWPYSDIEKSERRFKLEALLGKISRTRRHEAEILLRVEEQVRRGYEYLVKTYKIDSGDGPHGKRDSVCLFGDAEGALAANDVARIIDKIGIVEPWYWPIFSEEAFKIARDDKARQKDVEDFRITRSYYARVDLTELWLDGRMLQLLKPVETHEPYIGEFVIHPRHEPQDVSNGDGGHPFTMPTQFTLCNGDAARPR